MLHSMTPHVSSICIMSVQSVRASAYVSASLQRSVSTNSILKMLQMLISSVRPTDVGIRYIHLGVLYIPVYSIQSCGRNKTPHTKNTADCALFGEEHQDNSSAHLTLTLSKQANLITHKGSPEHPAVSGVHRLY